MGNITSHRCHAPRIITSYSHAGTVVAPAYHKFGGLNENRTRPYGVTGHYTNRYTMRPNLVEYPGIEPGVPEDGGFTVHCITIDASTPLCVNTLAGNDLETTCLQSRRLLVRLHIVTGLNQYYVKI
jgi:hypothetical protein